MKEKSWHENLRRKLAEGPILSSGFQVQFERKTKALENKRVTPNSEVRRIFVIIILILNFIIYNFQNIYIYFKNNRKINEKFVRNRKKFYKKRLLSNK